MDDEDASMSVPPPDGDIDIAQCKNLLSSSSSDSKNACTHEIRQLRHAAIFVVTYYQNAPEQDNESYARLRAFLDAADAIAMDMRRISAKQPTDEPMQSDNRISQEDIDMIASHCNCPTHVAVDVLRRHEGDLLAAMMELGAC